MSLVSFGVVTFLIVERIRHDFLISFKPLYLVGSSLFLFACFIYKSAQICSLLVFQEISMLIALLGMVVLTFGYYYFKITIIPIFIFLSAMIVSGMSFNSEHFQLLNFNFQIFTTSVAWMVLHIMGILTYQIWECLILPHIVLYVAEACSGINHIIALIVMGILLSLSGYKSWKQKVVLVFLTVPLGIFLNALRIVFISYWTFIYGANSLHGPQEIFWVTSVLIGGAIILVIISAEMDARNSVNNKPKKFTFRNLLYLLPFRSNKYLMIGVIIILFFSIYHARTDFIKSIPTVSSLESIPYKIGIWNGKQVSKIPIEFSQISADQMLFRCYWTEKGDSLRLLVYHIEKQRSGTELINYITIPYFQKSDHFFLFSNAKSLEQVQKGFSGSYNFYLWNFVGEDWSGTMFKTLYKTFINGWFRKRTDGFIIFILFDKNQVEEKVKEFIINFIPRFNDFIVISN